MAYTKSDNFSLIQGESSLSCYQFNTLQAKHYFCSRCGIYTHHQPRTQSATVAVNLACLSLSSTELEKVNIKKIEGAKLSTAL